MLKSIWRGLLAERVAASVMHRSSKEIDAKITASNDDQAALIKSLIEAVGSLSAKVASYEDRLGMVNQTITGYEAGKPWKKNLHVPPIRLHPKVGGPFMQHSTCSAADFLNPEFERLCGVLGLEPEYHRKFWEWVFILHQGLRTERVGEGKRALGFAVGTEPLPSALAAVGSHIMATDAPDEIGIAQGWRSGGEHASKLTDLHNPAVIDREAFLDRVQFAHCDMTAIPDDLKGFDFCWSACSFEHLGSLANGLDFVRESVEKTLKPGGVAVHTTEFNWSSNTDTVEEGATVLYRKSDLLAFIEAMESRGHKVEPLKIAPDAHLLDFYVDTPPYQAPPHLKLRLMGYVSTSVGLVITRGSV